MVIVFDSSSPEELAIFQREANRLEKISDQAAKQLLTESGKGISLLHFSYQRKKHNQEIQRQKE